jgi:hypothetical protein
LPGHALDIEVGLVYITSYYGWPSAVRVEGLEAVRGPGYVLGTQLPTGRRVQVARGAVVCPAEADYAAHVDRCNAAHRRGEDWRAAEATHPLDGPIETLEALADAAAPATASKLVDVIAELARLRRGATRPTISGAGSA